MINTYSVQGLPRTVEGLTPTWLTQVIGTRNPGIEVSSVNIEKIIWGTTTKVLVDVDLEYKKGQGDNLIPRKLCIKGEFDARVREQLAGVTTTGTQIEAEFYNELGPLSGVPLPRHWYGGSEPGMGILILDNLVIENASFGSPTEPWMPDLVSKALDILARLHGATWGKRFPRFTWLQNGSATVRQFTEHLLMTEMHWQEHFARSEVFKLPDALADRQRALNGFHALWRYDEGKAQCVIHGDAHLGNTCVDAAGQPFFIDWAGACYNHWSFDISNFAIGALSIADRRATESDLLDHYLDRLALHGGPRIDHAVAWDDYRRHIMHGMLWMTLPSTMQSIENVHAMGERYTAAMIEHDTLRILGV
jgi:thiamine kinase-like enzyme